MLMQQNLSWPRHAHTGSSNLLVGDPMSGEGRAAEFAEAKR